MDEKKEQGQGIALFEAYEEARQEHINAVFNRNFKNAPLKELVAAERKWKEAGIAMREYLSAVPAMQSALLGIREILCLQGHYGWSGELAESPERVEQQINAVYESVGHLDESELEQKPPIDK